MLPIMLSSISVRATREFQQIIEHCQTRVYKSTFQAVTRSLHFFTCSIHSISIATFKDHFHSTCHCHILLRYFYSDKHSLIIAGVFFGCACFDV